ncbi:aminodeoxychorismate synthase component I [Clostridium vincentii]|uniref:Anthranilate synthase component 1 n=1 Tax=Clostridium vincentii TaxID=52704 RepID=A0A2T0BHP6_9CLOT|nr:aminodeoxychorismate synthase component I [Clostridium vincentii]PRR83405.1 Aminodeoxychorismate synthase component 1 [Clostridium vincentii]
MNFKIKELEKNYDPFYTYKLFKEYKDSIFLDSSKEDSELSLYSFIGINPICRFKAEGNTVYLDGERLEGENPFDFLEKLMDKYKIEYKSELPFIGGALGYFSYDIGRILEKLPNTAKEDVHIPDSIFMVYENIIIFDLVGQKTFISSLGEIDNSIESIEIRLKDYKEKKEIVFKENDNKFYSNFNKAEYEEAVLKVKDYIESGDVYIANMTRRLWCNNQEESFDIYEKLRKINKAPFSAYINYEEFQVISSSPERFLSIREGLVHTSPIKGTRPRGRTADEDLKNRNALINSEKDKSELLMIVDLERNDLSKVCRPNTVKVLELFKIEEYATVFHLVATIEGRLKDNISAVKCIKECFPGGSITGAPKIRAMEVIEEIEGLKRNIYTGAIGYFDLRGNCDFNIVIRTIIKKGDKAYLGVGGGITWDSEEDAEWFETIDKARALMRVL